MRVIDILPVNLTNAVAKPRPKLKMRCPSCGSESIRKNAWAAGDDTNQRWELGGVYDHKTCIECEHEGDDHFDRIDIETGAIMGSEPDEGLTENCVSGERHVMQPHPITGVPNCVQCCPIEQSAASREIPSTSD